MTKNLSNLSHSLYEYFNYDPTATKNIQKGYIRFFKNCTNVLDIACGRGEFLELLSENGIPCVGIEMDEKICKKINNRGLNCICDDIFNYLRNSEIESFDGIFTSHFIEHLEPEKVSELLELSYKVLKPNGIIVITTPNVASLPMQLDYFHRDFTHIKFYHPKIIEFFVENSGFSVKESDINENFWFKSSLIDSSVNNSIDQYNLKNEFKKIRYKFTRNPLIILKRKISDILINYFLEPQLNEIEKIINKQANAINKITEWSYGLYPPSEVYVVARKKRAIFLGQDMFSENEINDLKNRTGNFKYSPKISIITPVYNVDEIWLKKAINSVLNQAYTNWELCMVDDGSSKEHIKKILEEYKMNDSRIKIKYLSENQGISVASNEALSIANGEFVGFLDHDDELTINALFEVINLLQYHPDADMIYSDEDKIDINNQRSDPYFKPDWSPDLLLSNMYTCHFGVYRKKIIEEIGGFRKGYEGSQDYDLVLRLTEITDKIYHIPKILYHWRKIPNSTAENYNAKGYAETNALKSLENALERRNIKGKVLPGIFPSSFRVKREIIGNPKVTIIIPTKDHLEVLKKCLESIQKKTQYVNYNIIIVDNNSQDSQTIKYLKTISKKSNIKVLKFEKVFNFSAINNFAAGYSDGEYLLFMNNDTEVISEEWLSSMLEHAQRKEVGAVGAKLLYPDNTIQHAGIIIGMTGIPPIGAHSHRYLPASSPGYFGRTQITHNVSAVTAACVMIRKEVFEEVGMFDENIGVAFNDVDLCLKIRKKGYLIVYTPYALLYHHESLSRGLDDTKLKRFSEEVKYVRERWGDLIDKGDPYYNPNLTLKKEDFSVEI